LYVEKKNKTKLKRMKNKIKMPPTSALLDRRGVHRDLRLTFTGETLSNQL
jgi:hypothetical protein